MVNRMLQPQEIEVFYVLPALRREIAICMKSAGNSQKNIAKHLGITDAAVSQYFSSKRAASLEFNNTVKSAILESSKRITEELSAMREIQQLLNLIRKERIVCQVHETLGTAPKNCNICFENNQLVNIGSAK